MFVYELSGQAVIRDAKANPDEDSVKALIAEAIGIDADRIAISPGRSFWKAGSMAIDVKFTLLRPAKEQG